MDGDQIFDLPMIMPMNKPMNKPMNRPINRFKNIDHVTLPNTKEGRLCEIERLLILNHQQFNMFVEEINTKLTLIEEDIKESLNSIEEEILNLKNELIGKK